MKKISEQTKERMSISKMGKKNPNYKGGKSLLYRRSNWTRLSLKLRKNAKCYVCGKNHGLECHHVKNYHIAPELFFEVSNIRVLCSKCHKFVHRILKNKDTVNLITAK